MTTIQLTKTTKGRKTATPKIQIKSKTPVAALSFSLKFDPSVLKLESITLDKARGDFTLSTNENRVGEGSVGVLFDSVVPLAASKLMTLAAVKFSIVKRSAGRTYVEFTGTPAPVSVSDINGKLLEAKCFGGVVEAY